MININPQTNRFTFTVAFVWVLMIFGFYTAEADYGIEIRLIDKTVIRKDGAMKIVFDQKGEAIHLIDFRPGFADTMTISPCDLAGLMITPCDTVPATSVYENINLKENKISSYPNPAGNDITIKIISPSYSSAQVSIVGMDGKTVENFGNVELFQGENLITWNKSADNVAAGNYIIIVETAHGVSTTTQIVVK